MVVESHHARNNQTIIIIKNYDQYPNQSGTNHTYEFAIRLVNPTYPQALGLIVFYEGIETLVWTPMLATLFESSFFVFMGT